MWLHLACADPGGIELVSDGHPVRDGAGDQNRATVSVGDGGDDHVTWEGGGFTVEAPLDDGVPGQAAVRFPEAYTNHPQLAYTGGTTWLVAAATGGGGLWGGPLDGDVVAFAPGKREHPDLTGFGDGVLVASAGADGIVLDALWPDGRAETTDVVPYVWSGGGTPAIRPVADGWRVVWAERDLEVEPRSAVRSAWLDAGGALRGEPELVAVWDEIEDDARPALATGPSGDAVAWREGSVGEAWLELRDPDGALVVRHALHTDGPAGRPALAAVDDTVLVAWEQQRSEGWVVRLQAWDLATGEVLGPAVRLSASSVIPGRPAVAVHASGRGVVSWETTSDLEGVRAVWVRAFTLRP